MTVQSIKDLPSLDELGVESGYDSLAPFAREVFAPGAPRFLNWGNGELVVYRNKDLQVLGALPEVGVVPPQVVFGPAYDALVAGKPLPGSAMADVISNQVFTANPPLHKALRRTITNRFGPKQVKTMEDIARSVARAILDGIDVTAPIDGLHNFTDRITCRFFGQLLGMVDSEIAEMEPYIRDFTALYFVPPTEESVLRYDNAARGYKALLERVARRELESGHAFICALSGDLDAVRALELPEDATSTGIVPADAGAALAGNLVDGYHTAAVGIANALYVLSQHPDVVASIRADRSLVLPAIFEALRLAPPVIALKRWAIDDFEIGGLHVPAGTSIVMMWGVGGYDPSQFPDPESFVLERPRQGSTTFGGGLHICPGRYLAPMLAQVLINEIFDRGLTLDPKRTRADWIKGSVLSQMETFEVGLRASQS